MHSHSDGDPAAYPDELSLCGVEFEWDRQEMVIQYQS